MSRSDIFSAMRMALATIREHKLRSFLTVLGVIIGTGTMIGVGSIITGLDGSITNIFRSFGRKGLTRLSRPAPAMGFTASSSGHSETSSH